MERHAIRVGARHDRPPLDSDEPPELEIEVDARPHLERRTNVGDGQLLGRNFCTVTGAPELACVHHDRRLARNAVALDGLFFSNRYSTHLGDWYSARPMPNAM